MSEDVVDAVLAAVGVPLAVRDGVAVIVGVTVRDADAEGVSVAGRELVGELEGVPEGAAPGESVPDGEGVLLPDGEQSTGSNSATVTLISPKPPPSAGSARKPAQELPTVMATTLVPPRMSAEPGTMRVTYVGAVTVQEQYGGGV